MQLDECASACTDAVRLNGGSVMAAMSTARAKGASMSTNKSWMDESKWAFLQENWGLIRKVAIMWFKKTKRVPLEECESGAMMLAVHCLRSYDPAKARWSTYYMKAAASTTQMWRHISATGNYFSTEARDKLDLLRAQGAMLSTSICLDASDAVDYHDVRDATPKGDDCTETEAIGNLDAALLHQAINQLPHELKKHALDTLNDAVSWKNVEHTAKLRREVLEELRRLMDDEEDVPLR